MLPFAEVVAWPACEGAAQPMQRYHIVIQLLSCIDGASIPRILASRQNLWNCCCEKQGFGPEGASSGGWGRRCAARTPSGLCMSLPSSQEGWSLKETCSPDILEEELAPVFA